jgi:GrpB-like predicted nucleotidyltransferase (UPF0157 family)
MTSVENKYPYKDRKYDVVEYDHAWPQRFDEYAAKIRAVFGNEIRIEHIGSTSVPGMFGKPCVDLVVIVDDLEQVEAKVSDMEREGFSYAGQFVMEGSRLFRVVHDNTLDANVHFFVSGHPHIKEMISLRDYLRSNPEEVRRYSDLKRRLYDSHADDYATYRKQKDEYMADLKKRAAAANVS